MTPSPLSALWRSRPLLALLALVAFSAAVGAKPPGIDTKYSEKYIRANLIVAKTTAEQVRDKFGEPAMRDRKRGIGLSQDDIEWETWEYRRDDEEQKNPGLVRSVMNKTSDVGRLFSGTALGRKADEAWGRQYGVTSEADGRTGAAKRLAGVEDRDDPEKISVIRIKFHRGVVDSVQY